jgi:hypothetical protein
MEMKENVYMETLSTEQENGKKESEKSREKVALEGSAVLGKFKSVDALAKAYATLQAEFTRRSQKLKNLQREMENFAFGEKEDRVGVEAFGAEKLRKNALARAEEERNFDRFVSDIESFSNAKPEKENAQEPELDTNAQAVEGKDWNAEQVAQSHGESLEKQNLEEEEEQNAAVKILRNDGDKSVAVCREKDEENVEELFQKAQGNEQVRLRIIGEYLASIGKGAPLMKGGAGVALAPKMKATTLKEAGDMALRFFKGDA